MAYDDVADKNIFVVDLDSDKKRLTVVPEHSGQTTLDFGDTVRVEIGSGWDPGDDPYVWRLHLYAPNAENDGPDYSKSQGAWQCDCSTVDAQDPLTLLRVSSAGTSPTTVTLANREIISLPDSKDPHWLTGRIAWGLKPADPCSPKRTNLTFDPELINRAGTPTVPVGSPLVRLFRSLLRLVERLWGR